MAGLRGTLVIDLQVMFVMTRLRAAGLSSIVTNIRRNGFKLTSRAKVERSLDRLHKEGVLVFDKETREHAVDYAMAESWMKTVERHLKSATKEIDECEDLMVKTGEHIKVKGAWWYSFATVDKTPKVTK